MTELQLSLSAAKEEFESRVFDMFLEKDSMRKWHLS